jgi:hypothetical protein
MENVIKIYHPKLKSTVILDEQTSPCRFVWHVRKKNLNDDLYVAAYGLNYKKNFIVLANNRCWSFENMFPYFQDFKKANKNDLNFRDAILEDYSFWRIDTAISSCDWYVDPFLKENLNKAGLSNAHAKNYILTLDNIPTEALKLFSFNNTIYAERPPYISKGNGVISISPRTSDFDCLVPESEKVNDFKDWRLRKTQANVA